MEPIDNPKWLVGHRLGFALSTFYEVVHRADPSFIMGVTPGNVTLYHGLLSSLWTKGEVTWWSRKPWLMAAQKLRNSAFDKFEEYFQVRNTVGRNSPVSVNGYCTSCIGRIGGLCGMGYGTDWFVGRPPEALTFYHEQPNVLDDWVVHLAEPRFTARVCGATQVVSATSANGDTLNVTSGIEADVIRALRSYYFLFFASLDETYARFKKPFALALYANPSLNPEDPNYQPDYEFDEAFTLAMDEQRKKHFFQINVSEAEVYRDGELLTPQADMLDFYLANRTLRALWREKWFASKTVPVNDFSTWVPFPRDNPYLIIASTLLAGFLKGHSLNSGNVLALRLCVSLARDLAAAPPAKGACINGGRLLQWINSKLTLPPKSPVRLFEGRMVDAPCAAV